MVDLSSFHLIYRALTQGLLIGFCTATLIGPVNLMAVRRGILEGFQSVFFIGVGSALVDALCAYFVFAGLLKEGLVGFWKVIIWGIGCILLLYVIYGVLIDVRDTMSTGESETLKTQVQIIDNPLVLGLLLAGSNPFTLIYWVGVVSSLQFSKSIGLTSEAAVSFFSAILVSELVWFFILGLGIHWGRNLLNPKWLRRVSWISAVCLIIYGLFIVIKIALNLIHTGGTPALNFFLKG
jgi:threonine/homoserine/homoserine lactone efflux protein